jgi:hypothetical protein
MLFTAGVSLNSVLESFALVGRRVDWMVALQIHVILLFRRLGGLLVWTWASGGRHLRDETLTAMTLCTSMILA